MTKAGKTKKIRHLKKRIRKTLGTLFLVSAITVAAIPVENLQASGENLKVTVDDSDSGIPNVSSSETIYTTGDGMFQFAYVPPTASSANKVAVILGSDFGYLSGSTLTIPDTVDAYAKYSDNYGGSREGYAAVGKNGKFLFYRVDTTEEREIYDNDGILIGKDTVIVSTVFNPCFYSDISKWGNLPLDEFYYKINDSVSSSDLTGYARTISSDLQWIKGAEVAYIGNQFIKTTDNGWAIGGPITSGSNGVMANKANIVSLVVGENLRGIGNYAFFGCTSLSSIKLENGLNTVGNWAFANCLNIKTISIATNASLTKIGDHAFYNCQGLTSFSVPIAVAAIGDSAFESCYNMTDIIINGNGSNVSLTELGNSVFKNCQSLTGLTFPSYYSEVMDISILEGCSKLKYVTLPYSSANFVQTAKDSGKSAFGLEEFKEMVSSEFYFEGRSGSSLHSTATKYSFAFKYYEQDIYEIIIFDEKNYKATYRVNSNNELIYCQIDKEMENVEIPPTIGPYKITIIDSKSFQNNCYLKQITIPSSITTIAENAFKGCHNLKNVIFSEPVNLSIIGNDAFRTQDVAVHLDSCNKQLKDTPELTFTAPIGSIPFKYAMDPTSNINVGTQVRTYITFYSGWPTNLTVQYNYNTDKNELINYPTISDLGAFTEGAYPYITKELATMAQGAARKYLAGESLFDYEAEIIAAALNIVLPEGIEAIQQDLFLKMEPADVLLAGQSPPGLLAKSITTYGLAEVKSNSFNGCTNLAEVNILGNTTSIGDYVFQDCINLKKAIISSTVSNMGLRPFAGCPLLTNVDFQGGPYFVCDTAIIFGLTDGAKTSVIECLETRGNLIGSSTIAASELEGITTIADEAFEDCPDIGEVDLRKSSIKTVPVNAFTNTSILNRVNLPNTCKSIAAEAFSGSNLRWIEIPSSVTYIAPDAFNPNKNITFYCEEDSAAATYASMYPNILVSDKPLELYYTVYFWDYDLTLLDTQIVAAGDDAVPPESPEREGYTFSSWVPDYHAVARDLDVVAQYTPIDPDTTKYKVTFIDWDESVIVTRMVSPGDDAEAPVDPVRAGYTFDGWRPKITDIQENTLTYAQYTPRDSIESEHVVRFIDHDDTILYTQRVKDGEDAILPQSPTRTGYTFIKWQPDIKNITKDLDTYARYEKGDGSGGDGDGNGNGDPTSKFYTLTVRNGSGSGSYAAGAQVIIYANDPASGQVFDKWSLEPTATAIASTSVPATVLTMPEAAVTVTANFKTDGSTASSNTSTSNTSTSNTSSTPRNYSSASGNTSNTGVVNNAGNTSNTSLVIDKNGISNTGVASATVNGSSDDFVIKITESASATDAVVKALMYEYGDLTNIKYFPMDISLYDSTGTNKITDTTGLSISITIPIPDSLITYAGNNKAAGVVDEKLDKLSAKFTTISGVSCITFTAEHFSPYAIYVDTANLTAGTVSDDTPSTGDGIHPKWFLSIGLACISMILFMKKDKRNTKKRMVTA